jgi:cytochrome c-type biogenesis protein CcmE
MKRSTKVIIGIILVLSALGIVRLLVGFGLLGTAFLYFLQSVKNPGSQYFITVDEITRDQSALVNREIKVSGAVVGESIRFDQDTGTLSFLIANVPADYQEVERLGGLAAVLENAVADPENHRIEAVYTGERPDLLRNRAQAIVTGKLRADGKFYATELLLRCPSRYEEAVPDQAVGP